jgi:hypothetical protein
MAADPLDYGSPTRPPDPPPKSNVGRFLFGLITGIVISFVAWGAGWNTFDKSRHGELFFYAVIGIKVGGGIALLFSKEYRMVGVGLITSLPIGVLILFMSCFAHLDYRGL